MRDSGHEWEILFAAGCGPKDHGPYYAETFKQAKRWVCKYAAHHEGKLRGPRLKIGMYGAEPDEPWPWPKPQQSAVEVAS